MFTKAIFNATRPSVGPSGALNPDAYSNFKKLHLELTKGYNIAGLEPQNDGGSFVVVPGSWKYRGG